MSEVVEHLQNLIRISSVSSQSNRPVIQYAVEVLHRAQWQTRWMPYRDTAGIEKVNLVAAPLGETLDDSPTDLAFVCHTDTVPYAAEWGEALKPSIADGLLSGCGACDVKGFLACLLTAVREVNPSELNRGLRLFLTADEEIGCIGASRLLDSGLFRPRRVVIGEPTSLHPARAGKGYCLGRVTIFGQEAHSAHPQKGKSAIYRAARLIATIEDFSESLAQEYNSFFTPSYTTINIGTIEGGTAKNIIPGQCSFQLEWRPIPGQSPRVVPDGVYKIVDDLKKSDPDFQWKLEIIREQPGFETSEKASLVNSMETLTGRSIISIPFGSEASLLSLRAEEVVVFGPGDMQTAHSPRECVPLRELEEAVVCMKTLMIRSD